jgi:spermidine synthase
MSDTPVELRDLWGYERHVKNASGKLVHINGLGLGICTKMALDAGATVVVVELDLDVIELVGSQLKHPNPDHHPS